MKKTFIVHWRPDGFDHDTGRAGPVPHLWQSDMSKHGYINSGLTVEVEVGEAPGRAEVVQAIVAELRNDQGRLMAQITDIDRRIADLMCIEDKNHE